MDCGVVIKSIKRDYSRLQLTEQILAEMDMLAYTLNNPLMDRFFGVIVSSLMFSSHRQGCTT